MRRGTLIEHLKGIRLSLCQGGEKLDVTFLTTYFCYPKVPYCSNEAHVWRYFLCFRQFVVASPA